MKAQLKITGLTFGEFKMDELVIDSEMNEEELIAYAQMCVGLIQKALNEVPSAEPEEPSALYHVLAGKYDGEEKNCKYCNSFHSEFEAKTIYNALRDYPWAQVEYNGAVLYAHGSMALCA